MDASAQVLRLLEDAGLRTSGVSIRAAFPLTAPTIRAMETASQRTWYTMMQRRMPNGLALRDAIVASGSAAVAVSVDTTEAVAL